jgi:hypothetical protein
MLARAPAVPLCNYPAYAAEVGQRIIIRVWNDVCAPSVPKLTGNRTLQIEIQPLKFAISVTVDDACVRAKLPARDENGGFRYVVA